MCIPRVRVGMEAAMHSCLDVQPTLLRSALLERVGVPHAFTTRIGGISTGVYGSLNFGSPGNLPDEQRDSAANVRANWERVMGRVALSERTLVEVHQVHGAEVRAVHAGGPAHETPDGRDTCADALVTDDPARAIAVRVADCCPVLIASRDGRTVAAVHAGWRGVVQAIVPATIREMGESFAVRPRELCAAIGPCIGGGGSDAFEVGPEVAEEFVRVFGAGTGSVRGKGRDEHGVSKSIIDMQLALREQLLSSGLTPDAIDTIGRCTATSVDEQGRPLFYSHRRDKGVTGRMAAIIGVAG